MWRRGLEIFLFSCPFPLSLPLPLPIQGVGGETAETMAGTLLGGEAQWLQVPEGFGLDVIAEGRPELNTSDGWCHPVSPNCHGPTLPVSLCPLARKRLVFQTSCPPQHLQASQFPVDPQQCTKGQVPATSPPDPPACCSSHFGVTPLWCHLVCSALPAPPS